MNFHEAMLELFIQVFKAYVERKNEKVMVPENPQRLVRGTIVSNSSVFENQIGLLLHAQLHDDYRILVDYPIIFPGQNNRITPDILILRDNTVQMILELKIDLGYEKVGWNSLREARLNKLQLNKNETGYKPFNELTMQKEDKKLIVVPDRIEYATVIFCHKNGASLIDAVVKNCKESRFEDRSDYPYFILLQDRNIHPNDFTSLIEAEAYIRSLQDSADISDWRIFESYLRNRLQFR
ncbi:hypothetical protein ACFVS2_26625 [Brevibacillus sp. NPDC058079]|uniref:hypothetical protein n=1 Tax=Brevibacillus sp. NPDC058079 TaxID=3346330 RepID=UPI0036ED24F9